MICDGCGNQTATQTRFWYEGKTMRSVCDVCGNLPPVWLPDVYLGGPGGTPRTDPNLCDPKTGREISFSTKREKAAVMKYLGLQQARSAERQHGARNETGPRKTYFQVS